MPCFHAAVGESTQHFQLVIIPDLLHMGELVPAQVQRFAVQRQHLGFKLVKLFDHRIFLISV